VFVVRTDAALTFALNASSTRLAAHIVIIANPTPDRKLEFLIGLLGRCGTSTRAPIVVDSANVSKGVSHRRCTPTHEAPVYVLYAFPARELLIER
jgi:hypothetical protein